MTSDPVIRASIRELMPLHLRASPSTHTDTSSSGSLQKSPLEYCEQLALNLSADSTAITTLSALMNNWRTQELEGKLNSTAVMAKLAQVLRDLTTSAARPASTQANAECTIYWLLDLTNQLQWSATESNLRILEDTAIAIACKTRSHLGDHQRSIALVRECVTPVVLACSNVSQATLKRTSSLSGAAALLRACVDAERPELARRARKIMARCLTGDSGPTLDFQPLIEDQRDLVEITLFLLGISSTTTERVAFMEYLLAITTHNPALKPILLRFFDSDTPTEIKAAEVAAQELATNPSSSVGLATGCQRWLEDLKTAEQQAVFLGVRSLLTIVEVGGAKGEAATSLLKEISRRPHIIDLLAGILIKETAGLSDQEISRIVLLIDEASKSGVERNRSRAELRQGSGFL